MLILYFSLILATITLFERAFGRPSRSHSSYYYPSNASCTDYTIPLTVSTPILSWNGTKWAYDDFASTDFVSTLTSRASAGFPPPFGRSVDFSADYDISATFCTPIHQNGHETTVLLASHGMGFDKNYWNIQTDPDQYSFAKYITDAGYSVFFYDRLGVGRSSKVSGYVNQALIQTDILNQLSTLLRSGNYTGTIDKPTSLVLVGHSFGSILSNALMATKPKAADALVLTGMGYAGYNQAVVMEGFNPRIAAIQSPRKFGDRDTGYLTNVDVYANVNLFFKAPAYDPDVARFSESVKMPFAIAEILSLNYVDLRAPLFEGPVLVLTGQYDWILCGGLCDDLLESAAAQVLSGSKNLSAISATGLGHGLNYHLGAKILYQNILDFLAGNGF